MSASSNCHSWRCTLPRLPITRDSPHYILTTLDTWAARSGAKVGRAVIPSLGYRGTPTHSGPAFSTPAHLDLEQERSLHWRDTAAQCAPNQHTQTSQTWPSLASGPTPRPHQSRLGRSAGPAPKPPSPAPTNRGGLVSVVPPYAPSPAPSRPRAARARGTAAAVRSGFGGCLA